MKSLYSYVHNNPVNWIDPFGLYDNGDSGNYDFASAINDNLSNFVKIDNLRDEMGIVQEVSSNTPFDQEIRVDFIYDKDKLVDYAVDNGKYPLEYLIPEWYTIKSQTIRGNNIDLMPLPEMPPLPKLDPLIDPTTDIPLPNPNPLINPFKEPCEK